MSRAAARGARERGQLSAQLLGRLPGRGSGVVDSVFSAGFNVAIGKELIYVGSSAAPLSCVGAALPRADLAVLRAQVSGGDLAVLRDGVMRIYDRDGVSQLDLGALERIDMSLERARPTAIRADALDELIRRLLGLDLASTIGLAADERLLERLRALADPAAGPSALDDAIEFLLGRGLGLTPSGDDILMGLGVARWLRRRERPLLRALRRARLDRTTPVSRAYLRALIAGTANADYLDLARALSAGRTDRFAALLERIRAAGHTSGSDGLLGFAVGWGVDIAGLFASGGRAISAGGFAIDGRRIGASDGFIASAIAASAAAARA